MTRRSTLLLTLAAFAVLFAVAALAATGSLDRLIGGTKTPRASLTSPATNQPNLTPGTSASVPSCSPAQFQLWGAFNDCAALAPGASACRVSAHVIDAPLILGGTQHVYRLYLNLDGNYIGPGDYSLTPWRTNGGLDTDDGTSKVGLRESQTGAFWQSVSGLLTVQASNGRSGLLSTELTFVGGEPTPPVAALHVSGPWRC